MEQSLKIGLKDHRRFRNILVVIFIGLLVFATFGIAFNFRTTVFAAQYETMLSSGSDTEALNAPHRIYVQDWNHIAVLDSDTGKAIHQIPLGQYSYNIGVSLAVDPDAGRLFVTDTQWNSNNKAIDTLTVYRTSDWSIEHRMVVQDIVLYVGNTQPSIAVSPDGKFLYVYNYSVRERKGLESVRFWLSILDLTTWTWLPHDVDLENCGAARLYPTTPNLVYVLCYDDSGDVRVVDTSQATAVSRSSITPVQLRSGLGMIGVSSAAVMNGTIYAVSENREIHIKNPTSPQADRILTGAASTIRQTPGGRIEAQKLVSFLPIRLSSNGHYLLVPTGTEEERSHGIASEIALISTETGEVIRTLHPQPFQGITFASDGVTAFTVVANQDAPKHYGIKLVRLDLVSGAETEILSGAILPGMVITP